MFGSSRESLARLPGGPRRPPAGRGLRRSCPASCSSVADLLGGRDSCAARWPTPASRSRCATAWSARCSRSRVSELAVDIVLMVADRRWADGPRPGHGARAARRPGRLHGRRGRRHAGRDRGGALPLRPRARRLVGPPDGAHRPGAVRPVKAAIVRRPAAGPVHGHHAGGPRVRGRAPARAPDRLRRRRALRARRAAAGAGRRGGAGCCTARRRHSIRGWPTRCPG